MSLATKARSSSTIVREHMRVKAFLKGVVLLTSSSKLTRILVGSRKGRVLIQMNNRVATLKQHSGIRMAQSILFTQTRVISKGIPENSGKNSNRKPSSRHAEKKVSEWHSKILLGKHRSRRLSTRSVCAGNKAITITTTAKTIKVASMIPMRTRTILHLRGGNRTREWTLFILWGSSRKWYDWLYYTCLCWSSGASCLVSDQSGKNFKMSIKRPSWCSEKW